MSINKTTLKGTVTINGKQLEYKLEKMRVRFQNEFGSVY